MSSNRWRLVISAPDAPSPLHQIEVDADNWITALRLGREALGQHGGLPPGASCDVSTPGKVVIFDAPGMRTYVLESMGPSDDATNLSHPRASTAEPSQSPRVRSRTLAYEPGSRSAAGARLSPPANTIGSIAKAASVAPSPGASLSPSFGEGHNGWQLLSQRDVDATPEIPLTYRERSYVIKPGTDIGEAQQLLLAAFEMLQAGMATKGRGKYFNMAVFDHAWQDRPTAPPLITLKWKDWFKEPILHIRQAPSTPRAVAVPASAKSRSEPPPSPFRSGGPSTSEHDIRLAGIFEDMQDLQLLKSPAEGLHFATQLLKKTIACEAIGAYIYDINSHKFRLVSAEGERAEQRTGEAVSSDTGLLRAASLLDEEPLTVNSVATDSRYVPSSDAHLEANPSTMMLMPLSYDDVLLGMLQLVNRQHAKMFDANDKSLVTYVGKQLSEFVHFARIRMLASQ
ncbi:MAG: GAF domain-containing protein [Myxococcales bacterium]|nr:GAF domain-containing protein [Myxococcales bacterium]MCB9708404.1 GAF domain-containing protein [Myxococcales bacterium]